MKFIYNEDIGILFDCMGLMTMKRESMQDWQLGELDKETERKLFEDCLQDMADIEEELIVFFYHRQGQQENYVIRMYSDLIRQYREKFSFRDFVGYLQNREKVRQDVMQFYFEDATTANMDLESLLRMEHGLPDKVKLAVMGFYTNYERYIKKLIRAFEKYYQQVKARREMYKPQIEAVQAKMDDQMFESLLAAYDLPSLDGGDLLYTVAGERRRAIAGNWADRWLVVGIGYERRLEERALRENARSFMKMNVFGSELKLEIIYTLLQHENRGMVCEELAAKLGIASTTLKYNLDDLKKRDLLKTYKSGKRLVYQVDRDAFLWLGEAFAAIGHGGKM